MPKHLNVQPTIRSLIARDLRASGNKERLLTASLNVLIFAPEDQATLWVNPLAQAGFDIQLPSSQNPEHVLPLPCPFLKPGISPF